MKILLTGATGYIGQRLLPTLLELGHEVYCCVRNVSGFDATRFGKRSNLKVLEVDLTDAASLEQIPVDIDAAYYLVHSMGNTADFGKIEEESARNFATALSRTNARQVIYLSGIVNSEQLSKHLTSRKKVEDILFGGKIPATVLRAGIIVGSGSASFEIIRDLTEKLPVMVAPRWLKTKCQPIAIRNVIQFLSKVLLEEFTFDKHYDIYGPDILNYKQMLLEFARVRGLKRRILLLPVMTPKLSSFWLYFVTSTSYDLARNLVESMKVDVVAKPNDLAERLGISLIPYEKAIRMAFDKIEQNMVLSSWKDAHGGRYSKKTVAKLLKVPQFGVYTDKKTRKTEDAAEASRKIFSIGGAHGWYYANWLWSFRGFLDKMFGGVGLNRGRKNAGSVAAGDTLDFWRVIHVDKDRNRLLLYAEMRIPGEAWLEFKIKGDTVYQTATFRPLGLMGRLYWLAMLPFHYFIFGGMINKIATHD
ncbi:SDR family oxidoreductase [Flavobacterium sp.]|uniref:SDR family oxidoreductase n=1 Tax=Flavobacterium sp. TaxID=239 RepID=UPI001211701C|nr:SDR family oxidoreductase [Flavobacterium sp.]RZJ73055.1 MAG: SDR family oxidoreductase [Flavobacterium sp.]